MNEVVPISAIYMYHLKYNYDSFLIFLQGIFNYFDFEKRISTIGSSSYYPMISITKNSYFSGPA